MHKNYVTYVPMCKKRKSRFYLFHVPYLLTITHIYTPQYFT